MSDVTQSENPEPTPTCDTIDEQLNLFMERFNVLQEEAKAYGIVTVVCACSYDHLEHEAYARMTRRGNWYTAMGLLKATLTRMENEAD